MHLCDNITPPRLLFIIKYPIAPSICPYVAHRIQPFNLNFSTICNPPPFVTFLNIPLPNQGPFTPNSLFTYFFEIRLMIWRFRVPK